MLVLTRRPGESIIIGNGIKLTVVSVGPGRVKIGIEAPASVRVNREEIHARIQQEQTQEQSTDVLAAVSATANGAHADQPTLVTSGEATGILSGDAASQAPAQPTVAPKPHPGPTVPLSQFRTPRKPR